MIVSLLLALAFVVSVSAQTIAINVPNGSVTPSYGSWVGINGRLYQNDVNNPLAKINFQIPQSGTMEYDFNVRYQGGGFTDRKGGFGIQIFVDKAFNGKSWGDGNSYLLWLNYDEHPTYGGAGFRAQIYRSTSNVDMTLVPGYDIALNPSVLARGNVSQIVPVKIVVNGNTGGVKVYDPTKSTPYYYAFTLPTAPGSGGYVALRTNSLSVSFGGMKVTKLQ
jgi:hypothetical protein